MSTSPTQIETAAYELTALACQRNTDVAGFLWPALIGFAEQGVLKAALEHNQGNQIKTAKLLGIHRSTLRQRIALYNLQTCGKSKG
jgi:DNA-binding protein Fis